VSTRYLDSARACWDSVKNIHHLPPAVYGMKVSYERHVKILHEVKMREKIAFIGSHGTGKTTSAFQMAAEMKTKPEYGNSSIGIIAETARFCPYPINQDSGKHAQEWIFHKQLITELEMEKVHDVIICDRAVLDVVVYTDFIGQDILAKRMFDFAVPHISSYTQLIFKSIKSNDFFINDGTRDMDPSYRKRIEDLYMDRISMLPRELQARITFI
jgi:nicotinamide riboside kinase